MDYEAHQEDQEIRVEKESQVFLWLANLDQKETWAYADPKEIVD